MAAFLQLRSPTGPVDTFSLEDLMSLQDLPGYGFTLEELRVLPGLDPHHSLGSLWEMMEQLSVMPSHLQTDNHKEILRLNPSLKAALSNMKDGESDDSDSPGSVHGDEVGESRARGLFLATINGAPEYLTKRAMSFEMKEEKTPEKMVEYLEVFLGQGVSTGQFHVSLRLMKQLSSINNNMFNAAIIDVLKVFLEQHFEQETIGEFLDLVITELKDAKKNISCLLVEMMTDWVTNAGLFSDLAVQISKPAAALRLLKRSVIRREIEVAAPEGFNLLYQSLKFGLISPQAGLLSSTKEIMLEMIQLLVQKGFSKEEEEARVMRHIFQVEEGEEISSGTENISSQEEVVAQEKETSADYASVVVEKTIEEI